MSAATFTPDGAGLADPEIEVVLSNGDRAWAPDPAAAVRAARELRDDVRRAEPSQGGARGLTATFLVNGQHVRTIPAGKL
jgi:hypothetical protein